MIKAVQCLFWRAALKGAGTHALVLPGQITGLTPPALWNSSSEEKRQWKLGLMNELIRKVNSGIAAAEHLVRLNGTPNAALVTKIADSCHFVGHKEGYWNSTGIQREREVVGQELRAMALRGFELALRIDPQEKGALYGRGEIMFVEEAFDEAGVSFRKLLESELDDVTRESVTFYLHISEGQRQLSNVLDVMKEREIGSLDYRVQTRLLNFMGIGGR